VTPAKSVFLDVGPAKIYLEMTGTGPPFVMLHAGVADCRQWNNEFATFARDYRVVRYDLRGYGRSEPVEGKFSHMGDLIAVLDALEIHKPAILMGCSMGGGIAMNLALAEPNRVRALIMVDSGPVGLDLDVPRPAKYPDVEKAYAAGDMDLVAELETQIWFDGEGRGPDQVDQSMRALVLEMNRRALANEARGLGKRLPDIKHAAAGRLSELRMPVLLVVGAHDTPFILAAADYMLERIPSARKAVIQDAAHLPNMDQPQQFAEIVGEFLEGLKD
jgi:2-hydroxy-6-oxonona-2,4-dienedioate hydrolase